MRVRKGGLCRCARDATVPARPVGFAAPARLTIGASAAAGYALVIYPAYSPEHPPSETWDRLHRRAGRLGVTLERVGDDYDAGPADSYRAVGGAAALATLLLSPLVRSSHYDAPCSVTVVAGGSGPEKARPSQRPAKPPRWHGPEARPGEVAALHADRQYAMPCPTVPPA